MEPADLNSSAHANDDARLATMLRAAAPVLPDDGFSTRVLAALPAPHIERPQWGRIVFGAVGAAAGCGLAFGSGASWEDLQMGGGRIASAFLRAAPAFSDPMVAAALGVALLSLLVAFHRELRERLRS